MAETDKYKAARERAEQRRLAARKWKFDYRQAQLVAAIGELLKYRAHLLSLPFYSVESLAADLGFERERGPMWMSGQYDFTLSELAVIEEAYGSNLIAVLCEDESAMTKEMHDDNYVMQPMLVTKMGDDASDWCSACGYVVTDSDHGDHGEKRIIRTEHFRTPAECPNCGRIHTTRSVD